MLMNGAKAVIESLKKEGVEVIFGYPGGTVLTLYNEVYKDKFPNVLTGHEQGAVHGADGYARATGKVGVCFANSFDWSRLFSGGGYIGDYHAHYET